MTTDALPGLSLEVVPPPPEQDVLRTDVAAVLGRTRRGPVGVPVRVQSRLEYESWFGPVDGSSATPLAVRGFFENNGRTVWVLRVAGPGGTASTVWTPGAPLPDRSRLPAVPGARDQPGRLGERHPGPDPLPGQQSRRAAGDHGAGRRARRACRDVPGDAARAAGGPAGRVPAHPAAADRRPGAAEPAGGPQVREWDLLLGSPPRPAGQRPAGLPGHRRARRAPPTTGSPRRPLPNCRNRRCLPRRT